MALNTAFKTQSQPLIANNLELVILELQREFPSITTNEWEPHLITQWAICGFTP